MAVHSLEIPAQSSQRYVTDTGLCTYMYSKRTPPHIIL